MGTPRRAAPRKPDKRRKGEAKQRMCLGCDEMFESEWAGHRRCQRCKERIHAQETLETVWSWPWVGLD
jgi:uncharacterized paraquat-inducible protein A